MPQDNESTIITDDTVLLSVDIDSAFFVVRCVCFIASRKSHLIWEPKNARWFSVSLDRSNAPWAFSRGEPFRTISAIELFASLISLMVFSDGWVGKQKGVIHLTGMTDNSGNTSVLTKLMSSKNPLREIKDLYIHTYLKHKNIIYFCPYGLLS